MNLSPHIALHNTKYAPEHKLFDFQLIMSILLYQLHKCISFKMLIIEENMVGMDMGIILTV